MSELTDQITKLTEQTEKMGNAVTQAQQGLELATKADGRVDDLEKATSERAAKAASESAEQISEIKTSMTAIEKTQEYLEKAFSRMGGSDSGDNDMEAKAAESAGQYLRTGEPMDKDTCASIVRAMTTKSFIGVGADLRESQVKSLIAGNNPKGGYFLRPERQAMMIKRIFETSPIRSLANVISTNAGSVEFVIDDNEATTGGWVGETQARGDTDTPDIGLLTIIAHEQFAQPKATQTMLDDAGFDIEGWLDSKVTEKMGRTENTALVVGDSARKPQGFLSLPAWAVNGTYERNALEQINSGSAGAFTGDGVKDLQNSLLEAYQSGAVFGTKRASWQEIITLKDGQGNYLLRPESFRTGDDLVLLGKRVVFMDDMPSIANNSLSLVYGNFSVGYTIVDRMGFRVIRDELTEKPYIKFYTTKRTGGAPTNFQSIKIQKLAA